MGDENYATVGQLHELRTDLTRRQDEYERTCELDRKDLRGELETVKTIITRVEKKTDKVNELIEPIADMFKSMVSHPKTQGAAIMAIIAFLSFITYKLNSLTNPNAVSPAQSIVIVPPQPTPAHSTDAGNQ